VTFIIGLNKPIAGGGGKEAGGEEEEEGSGGTGCLLLIHTQESEGDNTPNSQNVCTTGPIIFLQYKCLTLGQKSHKQDHIYSTINILCSQIYKVSIHQFHSVTHCLLAAVAYLQVLFSLLLC
jgi:hypothetical protein